MRYTLFAACVSAATAIGCCHSDGCRRDNGCPQACDNGGGCFKGCKRGSNRGCTPGCAPGCTEGKVPDQPCLPGRVRIQKRPSPPPPVVRRENPLKNTKPEPVPVVKPKKVIKNVKHSPKSKFGHAKDFSWMVGQLRRVHVNGGSWKLRYAPLDVQDKWGGSVILAQDARIDRFKDGDFVYVEGEIIAKRPTVYLAGPLYRIYSIRIMTEADGRKAWAARLQGTSMRR